MTNWQHTLDIKSEYEEAKAGTLTPREMARRIARKIQIQFSPLSYTLDEIVDAFEAIDKYSTFDDTNDVMEMLYNWGNMIAGIDSKMCRVVAF